MKKLAILCSLVVIVLLPAAVIVDCAAPTPAPAPTPTTVPEPAIPEHFTTYTDEAQLFSISYPPDWELAMSLIPGLDESMREALRGIEFEVPPEEYTTVFFAGVPSEEGYNPNINILVGRATGSTLEEEFELNIRGLKEMDFGNYQKFEEIKTVVGGREAIIIDHAYTPPDTPQLRMVQVVILAGETAWFVTGVTFEDEFPAHQETINQVVRSLRIFK